MLKLNVNIKGLDDVVNNIKKLKTIINDEKFKKYIQEKCFEELYKQTDERLNILQGIPESDRAFISLYRSNHKLEIIENGFILYNDTEKSQSEIGENVRINYPNGFSIAKAVEYGIGIIGESSPAINAGKDNWEYNINKISTGYKGREIFYHTSIEIKKNINSWINSYINKT